MACLFVCGIGWCACVGGVPEGYHDAVRSRQGYLNHGSILLQHADSCGTGCQSQLLRTAVTCSIEFRAWSSGASSLHRLCSPLPGMTESCCSCPCCYSHREYLYVFAVYMSCLTITCHPKLLAA
jgi:hypothetical protein